MQMGVAWMDFMRQTMQPEKPLVVVSVVEVRDKAGTQAKGDSLKVYA